MLCNRGLGINAKNCIYEGVIVPTALYRAVAWGMKSAERRKVNILEMKCWKSWWECHVWIELGRELANKVDQRVLKCFRHMERMDENRLARRVLTAEVGGGLVQGTPKLGWMDGVNVALAAEG